MEDEIQFILDTAKEAMANALLHLEKKLVNIRAGKASPSMVTSVMVDYYGSPTPLNQVANVSTPDGMTISIQPWEKTLIPEIERGIHAANLGFNPMNNGESVIINVPPLTEERRKELAKQAKAECEETKVGVRNDRKTAMNDIKNLDVSEDMKANLEIDIQEMTDKHISKIDEIFNNKEAEIMKV
ncbi:MAG: ribosome recycling factor [Flavobacteriaceae bacterium]|nr:ribosome recycling factor [Flavobacteriaceae bacterium]